MTNNVLYKYLEALSCTWKSHVLIALLKKKFTELLHHRIPGIVYEYDTIIANTMSYLQKDKFSE